MSDQKGALDTIRLVQRLYTHLKQKGEEKHLVDFLSQIETKVKRFGNGSGKKMNEISAKNYWSEVEKTIRGIKNHFLKTPRDFIQYLKNAERNLLLHIPQPVNPLNPETPTGLSISQHIIK